MASKKKSSPIGGIILAVLMLLALLNSAYFFVYTAKFEILDWLAFNACSVAIIIYLFCFILFLISKKDFFIAIAILPLYYYGTMGLFVISWDAENIITQITHIIITLNVIWILSVLLKKFRFESLGKGLLIGMLLFVPMFVVIQQYSQQHMDEFLQLLQNVQ